MSATFYLGTHHPSWLSRTDAPLFVSAARLRGRKSLPRASCRWALDSGGFTEVTTHGRYRTTAAEYARECRRWHDEIGDLDFCAVQDWMCEEVALARTGYTVAVHQRLTIDSYEELLSRDASLPWLPVLQGWARGDYLSHLEQYARRGFDLRGLPRVGLGSVCRRQDTTLAEGLARELAAAGLRVHAFGFKLRGLRRAACSLASADSLAWSYDARRRPPLAGCGHKNCANCFRYAMLWRERVLALLARPRQLTLFGG